MYNCIHLYPVYVNKNLEFHKHCTDDCNEESCNKSTLVWLVSLKSTLDAWIIMIVILAHRMIEDFNIARCKKKSTFEVS